MRYIFFGRGTGLRVSEICLGCAMFGTRWEYGAQPAESRRIIEAYIDAGGTFIDTADNYQVGESEEIVGEAIKSKRDKVLLATKFSYGVARAPDQFEIGNNRKTMVRCLEASLRRLQTDRIDLYWVHYPDEITSTDEIVRGLEDLVRSGKILYFGFSNFPAWRVARAATMAELRGGYPVMGLQVEYSLVQRTPDRELLPAAQAFGIGVVGWSPLGGGLLTGKYRDGKSSGRAAVIPDMVHSDKDPRVRQIVQTVVDIAKQAVTTPSRVALAWIGTRGVVPIIGPRTFEQLEDNLGSADVHLSPEQVTRLDSVSRVGLGFPHDMLGAGYGSDRFGKPAVPVT